MPDPAVVLQLAGLLPKAFARHGGQAEQAARGRQPPSREATASQGDERPGTEDREHTRAGAAWVGGNAARVAGASAGARVTNS